ncbi:hypothetical protein BDK51DRAFT_38831, partial [Blyttiomyces helicus]
YVCAYERDVLWQGKIYFTTSHLCFSGRIFAKEVKVVLRFRDVTRIEKKNTAKFFPNAIRVSVGEARYVFSSFLKRDDAFNIMNDLWRTVISPLSDEERAHLAEISMRPSTTDPVPIYPIRTSRTVDSFLSPLKSSETRDSTARLSIISGRTADSERSSGSEPSITSPDSATSPESMPDSGIGWSDDGEAAGSEKTDWAKREQKARRAASWAATTSAGRAHGEEDTAGWFPDVR